MFVQAILVMVLPKTCVPSFAHNESMANYVCSVYVYQDPFIMVCFVFRQRWGGSVWLQRCHLRGDCICQDDSASWCGENIDNLGTAAWQFV